MITDVLLDHAALVPVALLGVALGCVLLGSTLLRSRRAGPRVLGTLAVLSLLPVVALTLVPTGTSGVDAARCTVQFSLPTLGSVELLANLALFVPPAFLGTLLSRRPLVVVTVAAAVSALIEVLQAVVPVLGRACDTTDWTMNTAGAVVGVLLAIGTRALAGRRRDDREPASRG
ncbi:VanZ family protein [Modestobacter sp. VKM Ac-2983]|uniref:VanZ family protein n=1 Tax=Modestobacter sp. VKM Ac-2983 TaxID=3004137 RepID=UPI0022ABAFC2|nr:VanZ family protein [Modestobacter sp. VKM Ac-2983]MCZ2805128.1 VanZ family protein [Modestobacter sp. VKM Ac-2983]